MKIIPHEKYTPFRLCRYTINRDVHKNIKLANTFTKIRSLKNESRSNPKLKVVFHKK